MTDESAEAEVIPISKARSRPEPDFEASARAMGLDPRTKVIKEIPWAMKDRGACIWGAFRVALAAREFYSAAAKRIGDPLSRKQYEGAAKNAREVAEGLEHWYGPELKRMARAALKVGANGPTTVEQSDQKAEADPDVPEPAA